MGREKELFRDNLVRLDEAFPGKEVLTIADLKQYLGFVDSRTVKRFLNMQKNEKMLSKCVVASRLS